MDEYLNWWNEITKSEAKAIVLHFLKRQRDFDKLSINDKIKTAYDTFYKSIR